MPRCSVCRSEVERSTKICPHCGAVKAYVLGGANVEGSGYYAYGPIRTVLFGILVPGAIAYWAFQSWDNGFIWRAVTIFFALPVVFSIYRLLRGGVWFPASKIRR